MALALLIGSFWGFIEATLGGALHAMASPISGSLMGPIGFGILFFGRKCGLSLGGIMSAAFVAALFKLLDPIIFTMPITHIRIINPAQAILSQGMALSLALILTQTVRERLRVPMVAVVSVSLAMVFFNLISYFVIGYKETGHLLNLGQTLLIKLPIGILLTVMSLYLFGQAKGIPRLISPKWYYAVSFTLALVVVTIQSR